MIRRRIFNHLNFFKFSMTKHASAQVCTFGLRLSVAYRPSTLSFSWSNLWVSQLHSSGKTKNFTEIKQLFHAYIMVHIIRLILMTAFFKSDPRLHCFCKLSLSSVGLFSMKLWACWLQRRTSVLEENILLFQPSTKSSWAHLI